MKISDLQNLELPQENIQGRIEIFKKRERIPILSQLKMSFVDFSIANAIRVVLGVVIFKLLMLGTPDSFPTQVAEAQQKQDTQAFVSILIANNVHWYAIIAVLTSFFLGSMYYIAMFVYSYSSTLGMKWGKLQIQTKNGGNPSVIQALTWYYMKILYPIFLMLAVVIFFLKGLNIGFVLCGILALAFSDTITVVFGIQPLYEKISGMKITKK
jgi:uncharacterized RDD family membrane protein YckC